LCDVVKGNHCYLSYVSKLLTFFCYRSHFWVVSSSN
jgi:hypothetical protein